jgi:isopenicillin-N epimerase
MLGRVALARRQFLVRTGLTFAAAALAAAPTQAAPTAAGQDTGPLDWDAVRGLFALDPAYLHFGGLYLASHPAPVREAIEQHRRALDANPVDYLHQHGPRLEAAVLQAAAAYLGAGATAIALTDSTTMGLGLLYHGLELGAGQDVVTSTHDFYATHESLRVATARAGARLAMVPLYQRPAAASTDEIVQALAQALTPRTRVVALTWVHSGTGVKLPLPAIASMLAGVNASRDEADRVLLCVDGVHGLGVEDVTVGALGCDFFVAGCHKWLFGPRGTGLVWGDARAWPVVEPTIPSFSDTRTHGGRMTPGGFHSFEHRWALAAAFGLHLQLGKDRVAARVHELNRQLKEGLAGMPHVRLYTPMADELSAGLVCFDVAGLSVAAVVDRLHRAGVIATETPYATSYARLAPGLLNSPAEVDQVLAAVRALA